MAPASPVRRAFRVALFFAAMLVLGALLPVRPAWSVKWPAFKDDLKVASPQVDPEADAEALLWQIRVLDEWNPPSLHSDVSHHLRIKVFTERGQETAGRADIFYDDGTTILDLAARTVRPDGSVVEVPRSAFYERTIEKASGRKSKAVSFAFPSVVKGCMVEYRWTERRYEELAHGVVLTLQRDIPVRMIELLVKPIAVEGFQFQMRSFNMPTPHFEDGPDGFQKAVLPPIDAWREEPAMPPEYVVKPWAVFSYRYRTDPAPDEFWKVYSSKAAKSEEEKCRPDASIAQKASELTGGLATADEKLDRLHDFCRSQIRNIDEDAADGVGRNGQASKANRSPAETLKRGAGDAANIDHLFAAMARSLGFETRIARTADRREYLFDPRFQLTGILDEWCVAVRSGKLWRYFDPAARYVPAGMIPWWEEGQQAILVDRKEERFESLPISPPDSNRIHSAGRFRLLADGTLEGAATETLTGHWSARIKEELDGLSPERREEHLKAELKSQYADAVIDSIRIENASDVNGPLIRSYHIRVPGYAVRAGSRLLLPPSFFRAGLKPRFTKSERTFPVYFAFPSLHTDDVLIDLPESFEVESVPDVKPFSVAGFVHLETNARIALDGRSLRLARVHRICENGAISFPASQYPAIKTAFERVQELDGTTLSLRAASQASGQ